MFTKEQYRETAADALLCAKVATDEKTKLYLEVTAHACRVAIDSIDKNAPPDLVWITRDEAKEFQRIPELEQRIRELEAERNAAIIRLSEQTMECGRLDANIERLEAREALLVAEVWRCWGLARQTIDDRFLLDMILDNRPAEVRAIVEGKK